MQTMMENTEHFHTNYWEKGKRANVKERKNGFPLSMARKCEKNGGDES
jgi:hypothetical protein